MRSIPQAPDPDDGFRPQGARGASGSHVGRCVDNRSFRSVRTTRTSSTRGDVQFSPALTAFGRYGQRDADIFDQPPLPLPLAAVAMGTSTAVQDVNPLYGRDAYTGVFTRPIKGAVATATCRQPCRLHARPAEPGCTQERPDREPPAADALRLSAGRLPGERRAHAEPGACGTNTPRRNCSSASR
jgi:hypothetical protein